MPPVLTVIQGPDEGRKFKLALPEATVGRGDDCDIQLSDSEVSRCHAAVELEGSVCSIRDLDSTNGIRINGRRAERIELSDGDTITIGTTTLCFQTVPGKLPVPPRDLAGSLTSTFTVDGPGILSDWSRRDDAEAAERARTDLEALYQIGREINAELDTSVLFPKILETIFREVDRVDRAAIHIIEEDSGELKCMARNHRTKGEVKEKILSTTMVNQVLKEKKAVLTLDAMKDPRFKEGRSIVMQRVRSAICAPLQFRDEIIGVIYADAVAATSPCTRDDLRLMAAIGLQAGTAVQNARLYEKLTEEKSALDEAHRRLKSAQEQLIQSEKLAAIGQLVSGIVHDIKNPVGVVMGYASLLTSRLDEVDESLVQRPEVAKVLAGIQSGIEHSQEVIERLLSFARPSKPEKQMVNVNALIETTLKFLQYEANKAGVDLEQELAGDLPDLLLDEGQIKQVLMNIVLNAVQAKDKKRGLVRVSTSALDEGGEEMVRVDFRDNGAGMTREQSRKIFDPFFTTKTPGTKGGGGTGLGMSMSYGIIRRHGGRIEVDSELGVGTTISLLLPVHFQEPEGVEETAAGNP